MAKRLLNALIGVLDLLPRGVITFWIPVLLSILTFAILHYQLPPHPQPISGPIVSGHSFTVVAMDGDKPVELVHEWSGYVTTCMRDYNTGADGRKLDKTDRKAKVQSKLNDPIVWSDTGRATKDLRYYLKKTDIPRIDSQLAPMIGRPYYTRVKILEDDPQNEKQTVEVKLIEDDHAFLNIYQVSDNRVKPVKWLRYGTLGPAFTAIMLFPVYLITAILFWKKRHPKRRFNRL